MIIPNIQPSTIVICLIIILGVVEQAANQCRPVEVLVDISSTRFNFVLQLSGTVNLARYTYLYSCMFGCATTLPLRIIEQVKIVTHTTPRCQAKHA